MKGGEKRILVPEMIFRWWEGKERRSISSSCCKTTEIKKNLIPIVGLGGLGKTTMAKFVYTLKESGEFRFDLKAWVYVSMDFKLEKVISDTISQLDGRLPVKDATLHYLLSA